MLIAADKIFKAEKSGPPKLHRKKFKNPEHNYVSSSGNNCIFFYSFKHNNPKTKCGGPTKTPSANIRDTHLLLYLVHHYDCLFEQIANYPIAWQ